MDPEQLNKLFKDIIGNEIGKLKLEYTIDKAVFLGPKCYYLETDIGKIVKVKGLNSKIANNGEVEIIDFYKLLTKDSNKVFNQDKWNKTLNDGSISIIIYLYIYIYYIRKNYLL